MMVMNPISWPSFHFVGKSIVGLDICKVVGLAMDRALLIREEVAINFFRLFLW